MNVTRPMRRALLLGCCLFGCGPAPLVIPMLAENNSGQTGTATLTEAAKSLKVLVRVKSIGIDGQQVLHFHNGQCGEIGIKRLELSDGRKIPLTPVAPADDGMVESSNDLAGIKLADVDDGTWVINIHDPRDLALYTSCGNIRQ